MNVLKKDMKPAAVIQDKRASRDVLSAADATHLKPKQRKQSAKPFSQNLVTKFVSTSTT
jgi:hypothetical protein